MKPYVFGHRGSSGYEIENTISSFRKAVKMGAGIETDIQLSKDNRLLCYHNSFLKIGIKYHFVKDLTYKEISTIRFEDSRKIPLVEEIFQIFGDEPRYSFDIANAKAGLGLINLSKETSLLEKIEITDRRLLVLSLLRKHDFKIKLIYTLGENIKKITNKTVSLEKLENNGIYAINLRCKRNLEDLFKGVIDNDFKCYIWGVNTKFNMKRVLKLTYKGDNVEAVYTDYPDILLNLIMEHFK